MPERRFDPTLREWRTFGAPDATTSATCAICAQANGSAYQLAVFDDPDAIFGESPPDLHPISGVLYAVDRPVGASEIVVYSDRHEARIADLAVEHLARLVDVWAHRYEVVGARDDVHYVHVSEDHLNRDSGAIGRHPHGRVTGFSEIPPRARRELEVAADHLRSTGTCVSCEVVAYERGDGVRVVADNVHFLAFVPFAARFPNEVHVIAHRHATSLLDLTDLERRSLAELFRTVSAAYDELAGGQSSYAMSMHQAPTDDGDWLHLTHLRLEFVPVGPEAGSGSMGAIQLGAGFYINRTTPEDDAAQLRAAIARVAAT